MYVYTCVRPTLRRRSVHMLEYTSSRTMNALSLIQVILLGANDAKFVYPWSSSEFTADYLDLIQSFRALESNPKIFICTPTVLLPWYASTKVNSTLVNVVYPQLIPEIAKLANATVIDLFAALGGTG